MTVFTLDIHIFGYFIAIFLNIAGFIQDIFYYIFYYYYLDIFITNCPYLWKSPSVFKGLVRSDHMAVI